MNPSPLSQQWTLLSSWTTLHRVIVNKSWAPIYSHINHQHKKVHICGKGGCLPATHSTNESSTISFHGNSILMVWGQHELTSNHRCVESQLCPFQQVLLSNEKDAIRVSLPAASTAISQKTKAVRDLQLTAFIQIFIFFFKPAEYWFEECNLSTKRQKNYM